VSEKTFRVLFLSQRNSARSIIAEAVLNTVGAPRFEAVSAGVRPVEAIDPIAVEVLAHAGVSVKGLRPKHYRELTRGDAPPLDFVFTLSDTAAGEAPPTWPGSPVTAHWPSTDPTRFADETERRKIIMRTRAELERRLRVFINLPFASLDRMSLQTHIRDIGPDQPDT
jgi:arsenate reductase (thioredoxin)